MTPMPRSERKLLRFTPPQQPENLLYAVELWTADDQNIDEVLARSSKIVIARAALDAAIGEYRGRILTL